MNTRAQTLRTVAVVVIGSLLAWTGQATGELVSLVDDNTSVAVSTTSLTGPSVDSWLIGTTQQLNLQQFWFSLGNDGQTPVNQLPISGPVVQSGNVLLDALYKYNNTFSIDMKYVLTGGETSGDLGIIMTVRNLTNSPLSLSLYQYLDFDLGGATGNQTVEVIDSHTVRQTNALTGASVLVTLSPAPTATTVGLASGSLWSTLNSTSTHATLVSNAGPLTGDTAWAYQRALTIPAKRSVILSEDQSLLAPLTEIPPTPEPATIGLLLLGGLALGGSARLRRRRT